MRKSIDCVMCGVRGETIVKMPKEFLQDFDGGEHIDWKDYQNPVDVHLCSDCRDISLKMATKYDTNPLAEWNVERIKKEGLVGKHIRTATIVRDMVMLVQSEGEKHVADHKVKNAKITVYVAGEHGYIEEMGVDQ